MKTDKSAEFSTSICLEQASEHNPFIAQRRFIKGYNCRDLWQESSFFDVLLLQFMSELPPKPEKRALEMLFIGLMNLGPRDVGIRCAMLAAVTKTRPEHLLPIGLLANQGESNGAKEAETAYRYIAENLERSAKDSVLSALAKMTEDQLSNNTAHIVPGFGASYGEADPILRQLGADISKALPNSKVFNWCNELLRVLEPYHQAWLAPGLVAAMCLHLKLGAREAIGIFQLAKSVGIVSQAMEQTHKPISEVSMLSDECYDYTN